MNMRLFCNSLQNAYYTIKGHTYLFLSVVGVIGLINYLFFAQKVAYMVAGQQDMANQIIVAEGLGMMLMQLLFTYFAAAFVLFKRHDVTRFFFTYMRMLGLAFMVAVPVIAVVVPAMVIQMMYMQEAWAPYALGFLLVVFIGLVVRYFPRLIFAGSALFDKNCSISGAICYGRALTYKHTTQWNLFFFSILAVALLFVAFVAPVLGYKFGYWWGTSTTSTLALVVRALVGVAYFAFIAALQYFAMIFHFVLYTQVRDEYERNNRNGMNQGTTNASCDTTSCDDDQNNDQCC